MSDDSDDSDESRKSGPGNSDGPGSADNARKSGRRNSEAARDADNARNGGGTQDGGTQNTGNTGNTGTVHYAEAGASYWRVLLGPALAAAGALAEVIMGDQPHWLMWIITGVGLLWLNGIWVLARRRFLRVRVTDRHLVQGTERLPVADIASVLTREPRPGTRVLGGGPTVPRRYEGVELKLADGTHVLAWSQDTEAFTAALRGAVRNSRRD